MTTKSKIRILAIETSCDETGIALVEASGGLKNPRFKVVKNLVASQIKIHRPFGGVVPNLAKREHIKNLPKIFDRIMKHESEIINKNPLIHNSKFMIQSVDVVVVTVGPGLEPALWAGIEFAKELARKTKTAILGANHLEGHLYSFFLADKSKEKQFKFPAVCLVVSGGHTILLKMDSLTKWKKLGETRDDAAGEAFDKVARLLNLPYPGGPELEKLAKSGNPKAMNFPRPMIRDKSYDFSFSGLKTAVLYFLRGISPRESALSPRKSADAADVAASFQQAVIDVLIAKTLKAAKQFRAKSVLLCGGVAANKALRKTLRKEVQKTGARFFAPPFKYNTDNAAMIGVAGYFNYLREKKYKLSAQSNLNL